MDLEHLRTIMEMADRVAFPLIEDVKTFCQAEALLFQALPNMGRYEIQLAMRWMLFLLARHGCLKVDLSTIQDGLLVWRGVQGLPANEKTFTEGFVYWMESKGFSLRSMTDILREARKFRAWMNGHGLNGLNEIGNLELQRYLLYRANGYKNSSKKEILGRIRAMLYYYQEAVEGGYRVPDYTVKAPRLLGVTESATSEEIEKLLDALTHEALPAMAGLMLVCVLGYGVPLKTLPLLKLAGEPGLLTYRERLPCRRGSVERFLSLDLSLPWIASYWRDWMAEREEEGEAYLFTSGHGQKRGRPVSASHCHRVIQAITKAVLGYSIPVNHLERGALKRLARMTSLTQFMVLTSDLSKTRLTRMMNWMVQSALA
ncbi:hypothetical protein [Vampirovibrio sp.]|uniref:hypothetical protein n=1 Tax=Vampirovibrio sp. TaxID=2717857 RepID=UPI003593DB20